MTKLFEQIKQDRNQAMKDKNAPKLSTLRMLISEVEKEMKNTGATEITDTQVETVVSRQIKKLDKEIEAYVAVNRTTETQDAEKELLLSYLPTQLTDSEIKEEVLLAIDMVNQGEIKNPMQYLSGALKGKADMTTVGRMVKELK